MYRQPTRSPMPTLRPAGLVASTVSALALALAAVLAPAARGIQPQTWTHTTQADFDAGEADGTVVTNHGDIRLAPALDHLPLLPAESSVVFDMARVGDWVYVASGPAGRIVRYPVEAEAVDPELLEPQEAQADADPQPAPDADPPTDGATDNDEADADPTASEDSDEPADPRPRAQVVADLGDEQAFAMIAYEGRLVVAISGEPTRLAVLDEPAIERELARIESAEDKAGREAAPLASAVLRPLGRLSDAEPRLAEEAGKTADTEDAAVVDAYIWDMVIDPRPGRRGLMLATGSEGRLLAARLDRADIVAGEAVEPAGDAEPATASIPPLDLEVVLDTSQANLLCLAVDSMGRVVFGTDTEGFVYRLSFDEAGVAEPFVVFDAPQPEIGAILPMPDGSIFVGTADAEQARPGRLNKPVSEPIGRPAEGTQGEGEGEGFDAGAETDTPPTGEAMDDDAAGAEAADQSGDASPVSAAETAERGSATDGTAEAEIKPGTDEPRSPLSDSALADVNTDPAPGDADAASTDSVSRPAEPTVSDEQRDRLRAVIEQRLERARETGRLELAAGSDGSGRARGGLTRRPTRGSTTGGSSGASSKGGNLVYQIDAQGFIRAVFQESVMVLGLARGPGDNQVAVLTGNDGQLFGVEPQRAERVLLADIESQQFSAVYPDERGRLWLGASNPARVYRLSREIANEGTFESASLDARQVALWGRLLVDAGLPAGTRLEVSTRSGNTEDPEAADYTWSPWSEPTVFDPAPPADGVGGWSPMELKVDAPPARFVRYRLTLRRPEAGNGSITPMVRSVDLTYVVPNLPPVVRSIKAEYPSPKADPEQDLPDRSSDMKIEWAAADPNNDRLLFELAYRPVGSDRWLTAADDLVKNTFDWPTSRVPDGRYELRVTADDRRDNPSDMAQRFSRVAEPVLVDNTPPAFGEIDIRVEPGGGDEGDGIVRIAGEVTDALTPITALAYILNDAERYQALVSEDLILDSTRERFVITLRDLPPGSHAVTLRAVDALGNAAYRAVMIRVD